MEVKLTNELSLRNQGVHSSPYLFSIIFSLGPWASEKTPLLQRTNDQARFLGAKSFIDPSYYTSEHLNQSRRSSTFSYAKSLESNARSKNFGKQHFANKGKKNANDFPILFQYPNVFTKLLKL